MRSSVAVAGRVFIMLACVVGIPALAISGTSWTKVLEKLEDLHWRTVVDRVSTFVSNAEKKSGADSLPSAAVPAQIQAVPAVQSDGVVPAGYQEPVAEAVRQPENSLESVQERLRQMGATYYLLESWGNDQQLYRFYCRMAVGGSAEYTRCFEATKADGLEAMKDVLRQIEAWRSGR